MAIRIVTDSSADLPAQLAQQRLITVLPCYVMIDGVSYKDGVDLSPDDFYQRLVSMARPPTGGGDLWRPTPLSLLGLG